MKARLTQHGSILLESIVAISLLLIVLAFTAVGEQTLLRHTRILSEKNAELQAIEQARALVGDRSPSFSSSTSIAKPGGTFKPPETSTTVVAKCDGGESSPRSCILILPELIRTRSGHEDRTTHQIAVW